MKTAIYIEDGIVQLVLTPENEFEKNALSSFQDNPIDAEIFTGSFYDCRGGWIRQSNHLPSGNYMHPSLDTEERSLIIRADAKKDEPEPIPRIASTIPPPNYVGVQMKGTCDTVGKYKSPSSINP